MEPRKPDDGPSSPHPAWGALGRFAWPAAFVATAAMLFVYLREPPSTAAHVEQRNGETVLREMRSLARLETTTLHVEKVLDLKDRQKYAHGLVEANDSLLYIAVGEVTLGVDLAKISEADLRLDAATGVAYIELAEPEVLSARLDESRSHVHSRSTDWLAHRNEDLEGAARREALAAFNAAGHDASAVLAAKATAEKILRSMAKGWGAKDLVVSWRGPGAEVPVRLPSSP